jgi:coatomer protein complex subunit gamma
MLIIGEKVAKSELTNIATSSKPVESDLPNTVADAPSFISAMTEIPQLAQLGKLFKSSLPVQLSEPEEEYVIFCVKHAFDNHMVFQVFLH